MSSVMVRLAACGVLIATVVFLLIGNQAGAKLSGGIPWHSFQQASRESDLIVIGVVERVSCREKADFETLAGQHKAHVGYETKVLPIYVVDGDKKVRVVGQDQAPTVLAISYNVSRRGFPRRSDKPLFNLNVNSVYLFFLVKDKKKKGEYQPINSRGAILPLSISLARYVKGRDQKEDRKWQQKRKAYSDARKVFEKKLAERMKKIEKNPLQEDPGWGGKPLPTFPPLRPAAKEALIETMASLKMGHQQHRALFTLLNHSDIGDAVRMSLFAADQQYWKAIKKLAEKQLSQHKAISTTRDSTQEQQ